MSGTTYQNNTARDIGTLMYEPTGQLRWARTWGNANADPGYEYDYSSAVCALPGGAVAVVGHTDGQGQGYGRDAVVIKYAADGTQEWVRVRDDGLNHSEMLFRVVAGGGSIYASGWGYGPSGSEGGFFESYTESGDFRWSSWWSSGQSGDASADDLAYSAGKLYFTGKQRVGSAQALGAGRLDAATGTISWATTYDRGGTWDEAWGDALALVPGKSLYVSGGAHSLQGKNLAVGMRFKP